MSDTDPAVPAPYYRYWAKTAGADAGPVPRFHRLPYHLLDVAAAGEAVLRSDALLSARLARVARLPEHDVVPLVAHLLALHDVGKFAPSFQHLCPEVCAQLGGPQASAAYRARHDALGYLLWQESLLEDALRSGTWPWGGAELSQEDVGDIIDPLGRAICGHHGRPPRIPANHAQLLDTESRAVACRWVRDVAAILPPPSLSFGTYDPSRFVGFAWLLAGIAVLADWLGSNQVYFPFEASLVPLSAYWTRAQALAVHAVRDAGVVPPSPSGTSVGGLFPEFANLTPLQDHVTTIQIPEGPACFVLEDDTGAGKTEAALILAHRLLVAGRGGSVYFGLPTMATANAMHERMTRLYERLFGLDRRASLVLAHSARHLVGFGLEATEPDADVEGVERSGGSMCARWLADSRKKALLAACGVGTIDQALLSVLPSTHQSLRLLGLNRGVLVVDEVHAYDAYMQGVLRELLHFTAALGGSAILLSATLPRHVRQTLTDGFATGVGAAAMPTVRTEFPLLTTVSAAGRTEAPVPRVPARDRAVAIRYEPDPAAVLDMVCDAAAQGQAVCWVRNTVRDAIAAYRLLPSWLAERGLLFHARFAMGDRLAIERTVLERFGPRSDRDTRVGRVLVATQVVEQSLDLDFDFLVSDLAPIDLLIQRVGRLHRHARPGRGAPRLVIHGPAFHADPAEDWLSAHLPGASAVYRNVGVMWRSAAQCQRLVWHLPDELRDLVSAVYDEEVAMPIPTRLERASDAAEGQLRAEGAIAITSALKLSDGYQATARQWVDDTFVPTRLGDPTTTVRLAVRTQEGGWRAWIDEPRWGWELSEVGVRRWWIAATALSDVEQVAATAAMPDRGQWSVTVALTPTPGGPWVGAALDARGRCVTVRYDRVTGLEFART